jgi:molecular chaperone GrpE
MDQEQQSGTAQEVGAQAEITRLKSELQQEQQRGLRTLADFENYRKRVERERASAGEREKRQLLLALLELADDFDRALTHIPNASESVAEGVYALQRRLLRILEAQGVTPFESVGNSFDPALHEALGTIDSDQHDAGTIVEELNRGYHWGNEVLRPARVRVVQ